MFWAVCCMVPVAALRLGYELWRLVGMSGPGGAFDLVLRYDEVQWWFAGELMNRISQCPGYPPASYVFLWLPLGWLSLPLARLFWALSSLILLVVLIRYFLKESGAGSRLERVFLTMTFLSAYPLAVTIGNGQLGIHLFTAVIGAILLTRPSQRVCLRNDVIAAVLFLAGLTKVSFAAPFFLILLFVPGRLRPGALVLTGYIFLTYFGALFQPYTVPELIGQFINFSSSPSAAKGGAHLIRILSMFGLASLGPLMSVAILMALGLWVWLHRGSDLIILMAVTAIVARLFTYHRMYDDILIFLPMVLLYRISMRYKTDEKRSITAGMLFMFGWIGLEMPATLGRMPFPWNLPYDIGQTIVWTAMLVFLLFHAAKEKSAVQNLRSVQL